MEVKLCYNSSDNRCINKNIIDGEVISGTLRTSTSIISPVITFESNSPLRYNYAYISEFRRYYYIKNIISIRNNLWEIQFEIDPLMSFKADICALKVVVDKQSNELNGDEYIDDSSLVTDNLMFNTVYNFPDGFNNNGEYILITAG